MFITFEGVEGSGKSFQARALVDRLRAAGLGVRATHEPGGTPLGDRLRGVLLARDSLGEGIVGRAEALLMCAARAQLVDTVLRPALEGGAVVVCDRFADSTLAYQGGGRQLPLDGLTSVLSFATAGLTPDMTILLDLPVEVGLARKRAQADHAAAATWTRFEAEARAFHERVRAAYLDLAEREPARWLRLDGRLPADHLAETIWDHVSVRLAAPAPATETI